MRDVVEVEIEIEVETTRSELMSGGQERVVRFL